MHVSAPPKPSGQSKQALQVPSEASKPGSKERGQKMERPGRTSAGACMTCVVKRFFTSSPRVAAGIEVGLYGPHTVLDPKRKQIIHGPHVIPYLFVPVDTPYHRLRCTYSRMTTAYGAAEFRIASTDSPLRSLYFFTTLLNVACSANSLSVNGLCSRWISC